MRVVVTGGAGFIGRSVVSALAPTAEVVVVDSLRPDVHADRDIHMPGCADLVVADVRDPAALDRVLPGADAVVHLAAKVGLGLDISDLPDYASSNDLGTAVLLSRMAAAGVPRLVLASSMVVYGEGSYTCPEHGAVRPPPRSTVDLDAGRFDPRCPLCGSTLRPGLVTEDEPPDPRNGYAATKLHQEHLASVWARETGGRATSLRFHNVYGPGLPRNTPYAGVAALFASALRRGEPPRVFEDGRQRRDFVHVRDVAAAVVAVLAPSTPPRPEGHRAYNVGSGAVHTIGDLAAGLAAHWGGADPVVTGEYRLGDVRHVTASSERLRTETEWAPAVDFDDGVGELARAWKAESVRSSRA